MGRYFGFCKPGPGVAVLVLGAALVVGAGPALAQDKAVKTEDPVVVKVEGTAIRSSDVAAALESVPPEYASIPRETLLKGVIEQLIDSTLAAKRASAMGLDKDPMFLRAMAKARLQLLEQLYLQRLVERRVTDRAVARRYERDRKSLTREKEVRARHILVKTRKEALDVIAELRRGADFAQLARSRSTGPSKVQGGDLGFFKRAQMVAPFSAAAFALKKGEVSRAPVQTKFGWHVIKVEDIKAAAPLGLKEVEADLRRKMSNEVIDREMKNLRKGAKIERLHPLK